MPLHDEARLVDPAAGLVLQGRALSDRVTAAATELAGQPAGVVLALMGTDPDSVVRHLGALTGGRPIALVDPQTAPATLQDLINRFDPVLVTGVDATKAPLPPRYRVVESAALGTVWQRSTAPVATPHPDLALLLTTSGSTGSPKLVRLSRTAVLANARSISRALGIDPAETAVTSLPLFYSYGMSVLNSHMASGATIVLERSPLLQREFWRTVSDHAVTSLAGVPYQYEMLRRLRFTPEKYPALRTLTQAGGGLRRELVADFHERMRAVGGRLFVMYGATEAAPRMTTLPAGSLPAKLGSVGPAIPGGRLSIRCDDGSETSRPNITGEVLYHGPNVMMGYAESAAELARPDDLGGTLATGDLGYLDEDGFLFVTGRLKRMGKIFGTRVSLADIEQLLAAHAPVAVTPGDDVVIVWLEQADDELRHQVRAELADRLGTHSSGIDVRSIDRLPLLANGKVDYRTLEAAK